MEASRAQAKAYLLMGARFAGATAAGTVASASVLMAKRQRRGPTGACPAGAPASLAFGTVLCRAGAPCPHTRRSGLVRAVWSGGVVRVWCLAG